MEHTQQSESDVTDAARPRRRRVNGCSVVWPVVVLLVLASCGQPLESTRRPDASGKPDAAAADLALDSGSSADGPAADTRADSGPLSGPPYPFVMAHGFFGFDKIGPIDYWWRTIPTLRKDGHIVEVTTVDPFNSTYVRGEQLLTKVKAILAKHHAAKVNIIGHSLGGIDARYVACKLPGRVASVTTIATPHRGSRMADQLYKVKGIFTNKLAEAFIKAVAPKLWGDPAAKTNLEASMKFLRRDSLKTFNAAYPDQPGVTYYSISGRSNKALAPTECNNPNAPPFIATFAQVKDPIDPLLLPIALFLGGSLTNPAPNDGIVELSSTKWGTWLGCIPADHMDQVGHLMGDNPGRGNTFNHVTFYRELLAWLVKQGF